MKKVITYGTYDLLHEGHLNLLRRAKELGDYLIVGVTSDSFDQERGKLNVHNNVLERIQAIKDTGFADEVIIEEHIGQKIDDIQFHQIDVFAIGSDWEGKFDYLKEYCEVVYLPRTEGISSTMLRAGKDRVFKLGIIGSGRIANRFVPEARYVSRVEVVSIYNPDSSEAFEFKQRFGLNESHSDLSEFYKNIDAVYIASPHLTHYEYIKSSLLNGKHVLCEIPLCLKGEEAKEVYELAKSRNLVLLEACKTAFCPAFLHLVRIIKSGIIGDVVDVQASLSKLVDRSMREFNGSEAGGSITELSPLPLMVILKLLGRKIKNVTYYSLFENDVDIFTKGIFTFSGAVASITIGLGVKTEGNLVVSGTKGYLYVPSPWWKTEYFEIRYEDQNNNRKFYYHFAEEGLRYEIQEFISMIAGQRTSTYKMKAEESITIADIIECFRKGENLTRL
ncbi:Gfo/Idh/MocA family oxidoreductase [Sphingobacterium composti Ten et al. 2007 non Yoo et al. 2007]|uniref:Gfo/Idh/MocA family oxidoreductase n=1 Tax=Sphingobacterium composti TaxID=363260 RepID=UPI00135C5649|nr:Gfo/Idh/MocA family oxidoreductase [Sphingobacterium composti Ten et al. 2007 non Yoo et al. 2007]